MKPVARSRTLAAAALVLGLAGASAAQARTSVYLSVGVPGVYVQPAPVYVQPAPVYVEPYPVYVQPQPVYVQPQPVYYYGAPAVYVRPYGWGYERHWRHHHRRHHHHHHRY